MHRMNKNIILVHQIPFMTRLIFLFSFAFISLYCNSQMTLNEMKNILKLDINKFETYTLNRGYSFSGVDESEYVSGVSYVIGKGSLTKYLTFYDKWATRGKVVTYQTGDKNEYLNLKKQIEQEGFNLFKTETFNGRIVKEYRNENFVLNIHSGQIDGIDVFEITLYFLSE